jgi:hypothetical protein
MQLHVMSRRATYEQCRILAFFWLICERYFCQAFLMRKLKIGGSMALALKLQPILDAAAPRAKL